MQFAMQLMKWNMLQYFEVFPFPFWLWEPQIKFSYHHKVLTLGHKVPNAYHKLSFHNILKYFLFLSNLESHKSSFHILTKYFSVGFLLRFQSFHISTKLFSYPLADKILNGCHPYRGDKKLFGEWPKIVVFF